LEPLQQCQRLRVIGEAIQGNWLRWIGLGFDYVTHLEDILACARREAGQLVIRRNIVDEGIVESFAEFVRQSENIGENRGIPKNVIGDCRVERDGKVKRLHENLVIGLVDFKRSMESANAAVHGLLRNEVAVHSVSGEKDRNRLNVDRLRLNQGIQLWIDEVDVDQSEEVSRCIGEHLGRAERHFDLNGNESLGMTQENVETVAAIVAVAVVTMAVKQRKEFRPHVRVFILRKTGSELGGLE